MNRRGRVLVCLTTAVLAATGLGQLPASAGPTVGADLRLVQTRDSLLARHDTYEQLYAGVPVLDGYYVQHVARADGAITVTDSRVALSAPAVTTATVAEATADRTALARVGGTVARSRLVVVPGSPSVLAWAVENADSQRALIDARTGVVVRVDSLVKQATGKGRAFDPNPVVDLQNEGLTDQADANAAVPATAYRQVVLRHLDGSGYLHGSYATIALATSKQAFAPSGTFAYGRNSDLFEQVESYYAVDTAQNYLQSLGFTDVNNEPQDLLPDAIPDDNSFYSPSADTITLGTGGVDDAEDPEVIWHELGHAVQDDQVPGFGASEEAGSIGEGFGDYLALTMSQRTSPDSAVTPWACIMDWDSTSYTRTVPHCIRRADTDKHYPQDLTGEVHADGEIWSGALYDINRALGRERADTAIIEGQFSFAPRTTFDAASAAIVAATRALYGASTATTVQQIFAARGIG